MSEMMNVRRVASLAKLSISPEEEARLSAEMADILAFAKQLEQLDLSDVPQMQHILDQVNVLRADEAAPSLPLETILAAAPSRAEGFIAVPRTVE